MSAVRRGRARSTRGGVVGKWKAVGCFGMKTSTPVPLVWDSYRMLTHGLSMLDCGYRMSTWLREYALRET